MLARIIGTVVILVVLYAIISQPQQSANTTRSGVNSLEAAGHQVVVFLTSVVNNLNANGHQVSYVPAGSAAAGDGSSQP